MRPAQLHTIEVGDSLDVWREAGFSGAASIQIGSVQIVASDAGKGVTGVGIEGVHQLDGLAMATHPAPEAAAAGAEPHPNGVIGIDHIVAFTGHSDRTTSAFVDCGIEARRQRVFHTDDGPRRQTFFWLGDVICELAGPDGVDPDPDVAARPARWWGLALTVSDIHATAAALGDLVTAPKPAVQPGREVCTLRREAGVTVPVLFISPHVAATDSGADR